MIAFHRVVLPLSIVVLMGNIVPAPPTSPAQTPGAGHFPYLEDPVVLFAAADAFLQGAWPPGARRVTAPGGRRPVGRSDEPPGPRHHG